MSAPATVAVELPRFDRHFWDGTFRFTRIGEGALGGKAAGLVLIKDLLLEKIDPAAFPEFDLTVPTMAVLATGCYDRFMERNRLWSLPVETLTDEHIAHAFLEADLPTEELGDLRALIEQVKTPLAVRSSSLLEDALERPFAGVYATKMLPNNDLDPDHRFQHLVEAIKLVYASTFFREARDYIVTTGRRPREEKMAAILQEVVGRRHRDRFYPDVSGVARSINFYPNWPAKPEDGVATLAIGLGKTIVDGGIAWSFSPRFPRRPPPFTSPDEMLANTQTMFWAINMGEPLSYDPVNEDEHLVLPALEDAAADEVLHPVCSTFDADSNIMLSGLHSAGFPIVNFAPVLEEGSVALAAFIRELLRAGEEATGAKVEIEFALTWSERRGQPLRARVGFLQVRPLTMVGEKVDLTPEDLADPRAVIASDRVIGNGVFSDIFDIVYVIPEHFSSSCTSAVAQQVGVINRELVREGRPYLLIGFGRWGSSQVTLGIPVAWSQIS
ncbi:MAG TPA: PEP/pyruvate-binding domain-containing protein, partial [Terriglobales bacterium]|nr:PEP/pyruvate-binding domain-containing protein [Terriglobales bacterium]